MSPNMTNRVNDARRRRRKERESAAASREVKKSRQEGRERGEIPR